MEPAFHTPVPGSNGMFQRFGVTSRPVSPPASHEGSVVFWGEYLDLDNNNLPVHGLFRFSPGVGIERLVDSTTTIPGKSEPFEGITEFSANDGNVVFLALAIRIRILRDFIVR